MRRARGPLTNRAIAALLLLLLLSPAATSDDLQPAAAAAVLTREPYALCSPPATTSWLDPTATLPTAHNTSDTLQDLLVPPGAGLLLAHSRLLPRLRLIVAGCVVLWACGPEPVTLHFHSIQVRLHIDRAGKRLPLGHLMQLPTSQTLLRCWAVVGSLPAPARRAQTPAWTCISPATPQVQTRQARRADCCSVRKAAGPHRAAESPRLGWLGRPTARTRRLRARTICWHGARGGTCSSAWLRQALGGAQQRCSWPGTAPS